MRKAATSRDLFAKLEDELKKKPIAAAKPAKAKRNGGASSDDAYTAADIEVLEGLEPVRRRPGMYIGGTDEKALHHLFAEVLDNSMDEAVAGHASRIEVSFEDDGFLSVTDNGRGIPVDPHPKFKKKSALEVIMTTLHSGGKFNSKVYDTSGGLHGVGVSVVNALSETLEVEVARGQKLYRQTYTRGEPDGPLKSLGPVKNRRGTTIRFKPDPKIFGKGAAFVPARLFRMSRSKSYLFGGVEIRWSCAAALLAGDKDTPQSAVLHFPGGLKDFLADRIEGLETVTKEFFTGKSNKREGHGTVEWAIAWVAGEDGFLNSYCNTVPTPDGGTHEAGLRSALVKGLRAMANSPVISVARSLRLRTCSPPAAPSSLSSSASPSSKARPRTGWRPRKRPASSRSQCAMPSTIGLPATRRRPIACSTGWSTAPRSGFAARRKKRSAGRLRRAACGCQASLPTAR